MPNIADEIKESFRRGSAVTKLIYINLGVFVFLYIVLAVLFLFNKIEFYRYLVNQLMLPASLQALLYRPWTIITYQFLHAGFTHAGDTNGGFLHILFNMLWLFWFGRIFLKYLTEKQLMTTYLLGGIAGAALFIFSYNVFPVLKQYVDLAVVLGASASISAIVIGISFYAPNYTVYIPFIGPVKIIYIAVIFIVLDVIQIPVSNAGGHIAHLGGAMYGYFFAMRMKKGRDVGKGFSAFIDSIVAFFKRRPKMKVSYKNQAKEMDDFEYNKAKADHQKEIDRILDKIAKSGYDSLTKKEKETLFRMSNKS